MEKFILPLESSLLSLPVVRITAHDNNDLKSIKNYLSSELHSGYFYVEIPSSNLSVVHLFEDFGFRFSEFRIHLTLELDLYDDYSRAFYPYVADFVSDDEYLENALDILSQTLPDDRFSNDPQIPPYFSLERNKAHLLKSFQNYPNEWIIGVYHQQTSELVGFWSMGINSQESAFLYQFGVRKVEDPIFLTHCTDALSFSFLKHQGIKRVQSISTGFNIAEINRFIIGAGFKVTNSNVIMRKIIQPA